MNGIKLFLSDYIESVTNPEGRFATLGDLIAVTDQMGEVVMSVNSRSVDFPVIVDGTKHTLKCLFNPAQAHNMRLRETAVIASNLDSPYLTSYRYLPAEMIVFDSSNRARCCDVVLQAVPEGKSLAELIPLWQRNTDPDTRARVCAQLGELCTWMERAGFCHGRIRPADIYISEELNPVLVNYEHAYRGDPAKDRARIRRMIDFIEGINTVAYPVHHSRGLTAAEPPARYDFIGPMSDMLCRALQDGEWVYVDDLGRRSISGAFIDAYDFHEGRAVVETGQGFGLIDRKGNFVIPPVFDDMEWDGYNNIAIVTREGMSGLCSREGDHITGLIYDQIIGGDDPMPVRSGGKMGYIHRDGSIAIAPVFDDAFGFRDGVARVVSKGRQYLIDSEGNRVDEIVEKIR